MSEAQLTLSWQRVLNWRDARFRRRPELRLRRLEQALEFVDDVGISLLFPHPPLACPTLWEAICGEVRRLPTHHHEDRELGYLWEWKDELPSRGLIYYGKLLRNRPTLVSLRLLPYFYALSGNLGAVDDYLQEYADGKLSDEGKRVIEALLEHGPLPTSVLRREAGLAGKANVTRFDRALVELQMGLKIIKVGISDANAWKYCYVYDLLMKRWPDVAERAGGLSASSALTALLLQHLHNVGAVTEREVVRLFGWAPQRLAELCSKLAAEDLLRTDVVIEGAPEKCLALPLLVNVQSRL